MTSIPVSPRGAPEDDDDDEISTAENPGLVPSFDVTYTDTSIPDFSLYEFPGCDEIDGGVLVVAFPTTHSVTSLVTCGYLVEQLKLPLIASANCDLFPPRVILEQSVASYSVRISGAKFSKIAEANRAKSKNNKSDTQPTASSSESPEESADASQKDNSSEDDAEDTTKDPIFPSICVLQCDLKITNKGMTLLSKLIINFVKRHKISQVICIEGLPMEAEKLRRAVKKKGGLRVRYVTTSRQIYDLLQKAKKKLVPVPNGVIGGFTGLMMSAAPYQNFNNTILFSPTTQDYPDAYSAVAIIKFFNLHFHFNVDLSLLENKAHKLELAIKKVISTQQRKNSGPDYYT